MTSRPERTAWTPAFALAGLAVASQAAALSLIDSPPFAVYQHYWPWLRLRRELPIGLFVLVVQAIVCLAIAYRERNALLSGIRRLTSPWTGLVILGLLAFSSAIPTEGVQRFAGETMLSCLVAAMAALNFVLAARAVPERALERLGDFLSARLTLSRGVCRGTRTWDAALPWACAAWVFVVTALVAIFVFDRVAQIDDSIAYLFQAKHLALGHWWLPRPADPESFGVAHLIVNGDKWYSKFFPGWPIILTLGQLAHVPWLVNPLLAAATMLVGHALLRRIYDVRTAHIVTVLLSVSPWLLFLSGSMMAHASALFWMTLALLAIDFQRERPSFLWAVVAGVSLGMLFLTRPFDAALVGPMIGLWALGLGAKRLTVGGLAITGGAAAAMTALYFVYNAVLTGDPMIAPHQQWADILFGPGVDVFGFGPNVGTLPMWQNMDPLPGHGLPDVILNDNKNFTLVNFELFGWAFGSLAVSCLALQRGANERRDLLMAGLVVSIVGGHSFYFGHGGPDFGARYWYLMIMPLALFTLRGLDLAATRLRTEKNAGTLAVRAGVFAAIACASALVTMAPWRAAVKYDHYRGIGREFETLVDEHRIEHALLFVHTARRSDYQAAFNFNPSSLDEAGNIFVRDLGGDHARAILSRYPDRQVWVVGRASEQAPTIEILAGPLAPGTMPPAPPLASAETFQVVVR